jgi:hypothetical protein
MNHQPSRAAASPSTAADSRTSRLPSWWLPGLYTVLFLWLGAIGWLRVNGTIVESVVASPEAQQLASPTQSESLSARFRSAPASLPDEAYREAALADEARRKAEHSQRVVRASLPGRDAARQHWQAAQAEMRQVVDAAQDFPEGSLQWHLREELRRRALDAPQAP